MKNKNISSFIDPNGNDSFSSLKGLDLQDLLYQIDNLYLTYRDTLKLPKTITFGTEIEYENFFKTITDAYVNTFLKKWDSKTDGSILIGGEVVSPIMRDTKEYWQQLKKICHFLKLFDADTANKAGGHIHIGAHYLGDDIHAWKTFLKLYSCYESILYRFSFGDKVTPRPKQIYYAKPIADKLLESIDKLSYYLERKEKFPNFLENLRSFQRYSGINFSNLKVSSINEKQEKNTLEFRFPNATLEEVIWQNNINAFAKMIVAAKSRYVDEDFLEYKLANRLPSSPNYSNYKEFDLTSALEFVDLVFNKNIDKVYFLRQYLRDYHNTFNASTAVKAKKFIR